jgi:Cu(I)/Ag(I) efflux system membrane fusion protein/cobalt-zinc-cadmium efflux system membrane fusion protein
LVVVISYRQPLLRLASHVPVADKLVERFAPDYAVGGPSSTADHEHERLVDYWTCSMHPSVNLPEPGNCPICGMALVPVYAEGDPGDEATGRTAEASALAAGATADHEHESAIEYWTCSMHPSVNLPEPGNCPICGMALVPVRAEAAPDASPPNRQRSTFTIDPTWQQAIAVTSAPVERQTLTETLRTVGRITYDENRMVDVNLKLSGWIQKLYVAETGQLVQEGQPLLELYSPDLLATQRDYLVALDTLESLSESPEPEIVERAESLVAAARRRLLLWDLTPEQVIRLGETREVLDELPIVSPARGYVVAKHAVEGMFVNPGMRLYQIADLDTVWALVDIFEIDLPFVREGQTTTLSLTYDPERTWRGRVDYIYPTVESKTRTVKLRVVLDNPDLTLLPDMYVDVVLEKRTGPVLALPREAVLDFGTRQVVYVDLGGGRLQAREVATDPEVGGYVPITAGLKEGEMVVTSGHFLIDAESKVRGIVPLPVGGHQQGDEPAGLEEPRPASSHIH